MKRVAIPVANNRLSEYFGECSHYEIFEIDKKISARKIVPVPEGIALKDMPGWVEKQGITDLIAYKVNREIVLLFASKKVNLFLGIPIDSPEKLIDDYLNGKLKSNEKIIAELIK